MSGLTSEQLDELEARVTELLEEPWVKGSGRPRGLTLREALIVACGYERNNITEEIWAEIFDVGQSTISRCITFLAPLIDQATGEFRPAAEEAAEATRGAIALVDRHFMAMLVVVGLPRTVGPGNKRQQVTAP
jgi:Helix-turn-helix of DDE superfamily endonuclease